MINLDRVRSLALPVLADLGLEIYDLELVAGTLRLTVDAPAGGVDLDALSTVTRLVSRELDHADPIPGRYTLEVSSPGLERQLRTPEHYRKAIGSPVSVRTHGRVEGARRVEGILTAADDEAIVVSPTSPTSTTPSSTTTDAEARSAHPETGTGGEGDGRRIRYEEIERARTIFEWGPAPKPGAARPKSSRRPPGASPEGRHAQREAAS